MGCPASVTIGDNLTFSIVSHDPDTGQITDADSAPAYRVYEDETATPILTGTMAKLDDANTTGFYSELIACTAANGFEDGKTYTIYIEATVDSDTGGICYGFTAKNADRAGTGARTVTVTVNDGSAPLESARVRFTKGLAVHAQTTDASGNCTFNLDDGTYTVAISLDGYTYSGTTQVVDGDETPTYSMTALTISVPDSADLCTVQFRVKLSNTAVSGAVCKAKLQGINQASDGTILSNAESSDTTDSEGIAELQLVQKTSLVKGSGIYRISVTIVGKPVASIETTIPSQTTVLFEDLL